MSGEGDEWVMVSHSETQEKVEPVRFGGGRYERLGKLGAGAQGKVYKCRRIEDGEEFAAKELMVGEGELEDKLKQTRDQRSLVQGGPHMTKIIDIVVDDCADEVTGKKIVIVMQLISKGDLGKVIAEAEAYFPEEVILSVGLQVLEAINFLHKKHIYHMDVKPDNILVGEKHDGLVVYLTDFDACRTKGKQDDVDTDTAFTAPEVLKENVVSAEADIFGLGVVLYCFTTLPEFPDLDGDLLWSDRWEDHEEFMKQLRNNFAQNRYYKRDGKKIKYTQQLIDIIGSMLSHNPANRPSVYTLLNQVNNLYADLITGVVVPEMR